MATAPDTSDITALDLDRAYRLSGLRRSGIGLVKALETTSIYIALRNTAKAMKKRQQQHAQGERTCTP